MYTYTHTYTNVYRNIHMIYKRNWTYEITGPIIVNNMLPLQSRCTLTTPDIESTLYTTQNPPRAASIVKTHIENV